MLCKETAKHNSLDLNRSNRITIRSRAVYMEANAIDQNDTFITLRSFFFGQ